MSSWALGTNQTNSVLKSVSVTQFYGVYNQPCYKTKNT